MRRSWFAIVAVAAAVAMTGCQNSSPTVANRFGDCTFAPHAVCRDQNLGAVNLEAMDLTGIDLSGSDLTDADMHHVILRNATLVGTNLSAANLSGADLRGANLTKAALFRARLDRADWAGSLRTGVRLCQTLLPDSTVSDCKELEVSGHIGPLIPPTIVRFAPHEPAKCLDDGVGQGVEVEWSVQHADTVTFLVDGLRASSATRTSGVKRLPMPCDGKQRTVTILAFGATPPPAQSTFSLVPRS